LPSAAQEEKVEATMKDGVLNVVIPLKKSAKARKIEIKSKN